MPAGSGISYIAEGAVAQLLPVGQFVDSFGSNSSQGFVPTAAQLRNQVTQPTGYAISSYATRLQPAQDPSQAGDSQCLQSMLQQRCRWQSALQVLPGQNLVSIPVLMHIKIEIG